MPYLQKHVQADRESKRDRAQAHVIGMPIPGFVPNVIIGSSAAASISILLSNVAPSSVGNLRHRLRARSQSASFGACGRPARYSYVVSSGATSPARAPPSMDMLQMVIRSSIESDRIVEPAYSKTWPVPPAMPIREIKLRMMSLAPTPFLSAPSTRTSIGLRSRLQ